MPAQMIFLGYKNGANTPTLELFLSDTIPTFKSHGHLYPAVIGPFRTRRGAEFMRDHGIGNPHCRCVAEAEALARKYTVNAA